eukprot:13200164-Alexandrium_andersonii.AAC.1
MSASLVGSEMCIRDRLVHHRQSQPGCRLCARQPPVAGRCRQLASLQTVSYTHLTLPTICSV